MFSRFFKQQTTEEQFWQWFASRSAEYFDFEENQEELFDELSERLAHVHENLCFEFSTKHNGRREFVISADGVRDAFPSVQKLVATAPVFPQWQIVAFRPRGGTEFEIDFGSFKITPAQMSFVAELDDDQITVKLFLREHDVKDSHVLSAVLIYLDAALGEYDAVTKIGSLDVLPYSQAAFYNDVQPLTELPTVVDTLYARVHN